MDSENSKLNLRKTVAAAAIAALIVSLALLLATPLSISLKGPGEITVECGDPFEDPGCSFLFGLAEGKVSGEVDTEKTGEYEIVYRFLVSEKVRKVFVRDTKRPEITLEGGSSVSVEKGGEYIEYGYSAYDKADGDMTRKVYTESDVDTSVPGTYHVSYYAEDSSGNMTRERRTVTVTEKGPMTQSMTEFDLNPFFSDVICREVPYDDEKFNKTVIFGDSFVGYMAAYNAGIPENMWSRGAYAATDVHTVALKRGTSEETGMTLFGLMDEYHPPYVIIFLGNHTSWLWSVTYYRNVFDSLYTELQEKYPDTVFAVMSLPPYDKSVDYEYLAGRGFLRNQRINEANTVFCELCRKHGMKFINAAEVLKNPSDGYCKAEYMGEDQFHLSPEGFRVVLEYIKTHMDY